jgi:hypothetical protein
MKNQFGRKTLRNCPKKSFLNKHDLVLFLIVFMSTFAVVGSLSLVFPKVRDSLHQSAGFTDILSASKTTEEVHPSVDIFTDVSSTHKNAKAIAYLKQKGIIGGYEDGSFKPDNLLNRAELLKILVTALDVTPHELTNSFCFTDVKNEWFAKYVCYAKNRGWVQGYSDGGFHPAANVTKAEALKIILTAYDVSLVTRAPLVVIFSDVNDGDWYAKYVWTAQNNGWLEEKTGAGPYLPNTAITRAQLAEVLYRVMFGNMPTI